MSDHIPFEIQVEIIKKLPVKSLLQFRSVSKQWKSLIDSADFIAGYSVHQTHPHRLLVRYKEYSEIGEYSIFDSETFRRQEFAPTHHALRELSHLQQVVGSSHGLLCLYGIYRDPVRHTFHLHSMMAVLWNPSIRKLVGVLVPHVSDAPAPVVIGFGVCPITLDPTIVRITKTVPWIVEIFTLSLGCWRISSRNLGNKAIKVTWSQVAIGKFIYWVGFEIIDATDSRISLIVSFDMTTEEFRAIDLPDSLAHEFRTPLSVSNLRESLAVIEYNDAPNNGVCAVWMMNHDVPNSFKKLFTINTSYEKIRFLVFTESGEAVMETRDDDKALVVYDPSSKNIYDIGIYGERGNLFVGFYIETLLLLHESDCDVYSDYIWEWAFLD